MNEKELLQRIINAHQGYWNGEITYRIQQKERTETFSDSAVPNLDYIRVEVIANHKGQDCVIVMQELIYNGHWQKDDMTAEIYLRAITEMAQIGLGVCYKSKIELDRGGAFKHYPDSGQYVNWPLTPTNNVTYG